MARKYIVDGRIYEDNGTTAVIVSGVIIVQTGGAPPPPSTGAIMNQFQGGNVGADLFNGAIL